jgi:hypothetical protein
MCVVRKDEPTIVPIEVLSERHTARAELPRDNMA